MLLLVDAVPCASTCRAQATGPAMHAQGRARLGSCPILLLVSPNSPWPCTRALQVQVQPQQPSSPAAQDPLAVAPAFLAALGQAFPLVHKRGEGCQDEVLSTAG